MKKAIHNLQYSLIGDVGIKVKNFLNFAYGVGVPARIIKYRYAPEEIEALNQIAWWDWRDEEIRERFDDFYLPIEDFIKKYL